MKIDRPPKGASDAVWKEYLVELHACVEKWGETAQQSGKTALTWNVAGVVGIAMAIIAVAGAWWQEGQWHGETSEAIASIEHDRAASKASRDRELDRIEARLDRLQGSVDDALRDARR